MTSTPPDTSKGVTEAARELVKSFAIYTVEDDDGIRLSTGGHVIAHYGENSLEGIALLKLDAAARALTAALSPLPAPEPAEGIAELVGLLRNCDAEGSPHYANAHMQRAAAAIVDLQAELAAMKEGAARRSEVIERAKEALEPFAWEAEAISKAHLDGHTSDLDTRPIAVGHLRAARALLQGESNG